MNKAHRSNQAGFTVIELVVVGVLFAIAGYLTFFQLNNLRIANEDMQRKTAINAMYYALEEVFYKKNGYYPQDLNSATLPSVDPELFTDPDGFTLGKESLTEEELKQLIEEEDANDDLKQRLASLTAGKQPNYHYDSTDCDDEGKCKSYTLRADLVAEAQYVKKNRNH